MILLTIALSPGETVWTTTNSFMSSWCFFAGILLATISNDGIRSISSVKSITFSVIVLANRSNLLYHAVTLTMRYRSIDVSVTLLA